MKQLLCFFLIIAFWFPGFSLAKETRFTTKNVLELVAKSSTDGWWHKTFNSMAGNRYLLSFESKKHAGKLSWREDDIKEGKIEIIKAMQLAKKWCDGAKPFGEVRWEIDTVTFRFRSDADGTEVEFIYIVTLKTDEYKTIDIVILPNYEVIAPDLDPKI